MGQPNLTRETKLSGVNGDRENSVFPVQLTISIIGNTHIHTRFTIREIIRAQQIALRHFEI